MINQPFGSFLMSPPMPCVEDEDICRFIFIRCFSNKIKPECFLLWSIFVRHFPFPDQKRRYKEFNCEVVILLTIIQANHTKAGKISLNKFEVNVLKICNKTSNFKQYHYVGNINNILWIWKSTKLPHENSIFHGLHKHFSGFSQHFSECKLEIPTYSYSKSRRQKQAASPSITPTCDHRSIFIKKITLIKFSLINK